MNYIKYEQFDTELGELMSKYGYVWTGDNNKYFKLRDGLVDLVDNK
jgi:hypothetical protein